MDERGAASITKHASDFHGIAARDLGGFLRVIADQPPANLAAGLVANDDGFAAFELSADTYDAGCKRLRPD